MGETGIREAEQIGRVWGAGGAMDTPGLPPRVVWHTTESGAGNASFTSIGNYLLKSDVYPHLLYDPTTDRLGQYLPLNTSARALENDGSTRTNRTGHVCIQIEVLARAAKPFTGYWEPGANFRALMRAIRSWQVPDTFPMGTPAKTASDCRRDRSTWLHHGGHYGHCNVPGNSHWDPGAISTSALFAAASGSNPPEDDDMPIRSSLGKSADQSLKWDAWTTIDWNEEFQDNKHVHADGNHPGYVSPEATWADFDAAVLVEGLQPGDYYQVRYEVHDWKDGKSASSWTEIHADAAATTGSQYATATMSKGLKKGQHVYVAIAVFPGPGRSGAPAPKAVNGRWTIRQDRG